MSGKTQRVFKIKKASDITFRLLDFNIYNKEVDVESDSDNEEEKKKQYRDNKAFIIQMFGIDEKGRSYSVHLDDYQPFFYMKVNDTSNIRKKNMLLDFITEKMGKYYIDSIVD